jgi:DNA-binding MarR family transcriptional regulator
MIPITMIRKITGKEKIKELKKEYGPIENLKQILETDAGNKLNQLDLENWEYYLDHQDEILNERKTIFVENLTLGDAEFALIHCIKKENPTSISDLAKKTNKEIKTVRRKLKLLEKAELLSIEKGLKNRKKPVVKYDALEIPF